MAKRIENKDLFGADLFSKTLNDVKLLTEEINTLEKSLVKFATAQKEVLNNQDTGTAKGIRNTKVATEKLNKAEQTALKIRKEKDKLEQKLSQGRKKESQANEVTRQQIQLETKERKRLAKETLGLTGAYQKETQKLIGLRKKYKDLALSEKEVSKEQKELLSQITKLDTKLKTVDKTVGQSQRNVGNYSSAWQRVGGVFRGGLGLLGITAGLAGLSKLVSSTIGVFSSFQKANSGLEAVLGASGEQMKLLGEDAKRLGSITAFTASEVTGLQTSFARLGFPTEDIVLMTESTLNAAAAMGSGLDETATLTGATLKAFGLDASEAGRVNDVLAKSTSASALDFAKLNSAMSTIAPVANSFGFSVEGTTALLGQLSNAGFDASSSATATRNILLNLADSNGKLAKSLKEPVTDLPSLVKGLKQLKSEGIDLGEALELTDKRSVAAFSTFLEGTDEVLALNDSLLQAGGTAQQMADTQLNNLEGSITILNSAWEGFILSLEDGNGAFSRTLKNIVDVFTEVLSLITGTEKLRSEMTAHEKVVRQYAKSFINVVKIIGIAVVSFVAYRGAIAATNAISKIYTVTTNALKVAQAFMTGGMKAATVAQKGLNLAMKANPIGILVTLLAALVTAYVLFKDGANEAAKAQKAFNDELKFAGKVAKDRVAKQREFTNENIRLLDEEIRARKAAGENEETLDKEFIERKNEILKAQVEFNQNRLDNTRARASEEKKVFAESIKNIDAEIDAVRRSNEFIGKGGEAQRQQAINNLRRERQNIVVETAKLAGDLKAIIEVSTTEIDALNKQLVSSEIDKTEEIKKQGEKRAGELKLLNRKLEDLNNAAIENEFLRREAILKTQNRRELEAIKGNSKIERELKIALRKKGQKDLENLTEEFLLRSDKKERDLIEDSTERAIANEIAKSEAVIKAIEDNFPTQTDMRERLIAAENKRLEKFITDLEAKNAKAKADRDLKNGLDEIKRESDIAKAKFLQKRQNFKTEEAFEEEKARVFEGIDKDALKKELALLEESGDAKNEVRIEQIKAQLESFGKLGDGINELKDVFGEAVAVIGELVDEAFTKRIEEIDKAIQKTGERIGELRTKANEGQLEANESLAFEKKKEAELERERERTRKRQERAKAFFAVLTAFQQNDGDIGKTITDVSVLRGLASGLSAYDGVDDTGGRGNVDKKGGKMWTLHPNEQVWSKKDRGEVGFRNRDEIKDIVNLYDNGFMQKMMANDKSNDIVSSPSIVMGSSINKAMISKLDSIDKSISNIQIPENHFDYDLMRKIFVHHRQEGNKKTTTRSKLF